MLLSSLFFLRVENLIHGEGKRTLFICPKVQAYLLHVITVPGDHGI